MILEQRYDFVSVAISYIVSFLGIYAAVGVAEQLRQSLIDDRSVHGSEVRISRRKKHLIYLLLFGVGVGGVGVWGMHYISLNAVHLYDENGKEVHFRTNAGMQILSLFLSIITTTIGLTISCYDDMFSKTKVAIIDQFIEESKRLTLKEIRRITMRRILITLATKKLGRLLFGGSVAAIGMIVMLYVSMHGQEFNGHIRYNYGLVVLAIIASIISVFLGVWIFFRLLSIFPDHEWLRLSTAIVESLAATLADYMVLLSADYRTGDSIDHFSSYSWSHVTSFYVAFIVSNVLLWTIAVFVMSTARGMNQRQTKLIRQAEAIMLKVAQEQGIFPPTVLATSGSSVTTSAKYLVEQYLLKRNNILFVHQQQQLKEQKKQLREAVTAPMVPKDWSSQSSVDRELQQNMGFSEYLLHLLLLCFTCRWEKLTQALMSEFNSDRSSSVDTQSNQDIEEVMTDDLATHTNCDHNDAHDRMEPLGLVETIHPSCRNSLSHIDDINPTNNSTIESSKNDAPHDTTRRSRFISLEELAENTRRTMDAQIQDMRSHRIVIKQDNNTANYLPDKSKTDNDDAVTAKANAKIIPVVAEMEIV